MKTKFQMQLTGYLQILDPVSSVAVVAFFRQESQGCRVPYAGTF